MRLLSSCLLLALAALPAQSPKAETIYTHATIWTGVPGAPRADALAVGQEKILAVGPAAEVAKLAGSETKTVDLGGRFVVPGFIARLAFGSDWTVAPLSPLEGIYAAVTRRTIDGKTPGGWVPSQKITIEEALRAYTTGGAWAGFQEDRLGTLEPGKLADFVVLSEDLFKIDPVAIRDVKVLRTVVGGKESYRAE